MFHWLYLLFLFLYWGAIDANNVFPTSASSKYICLWRWVVLHFIEAFLSFLTAFFPRYKCYKLMNRIWFAFAATPNQICFVERDCFFLRMASFNYVHVDFIVNCYWHDTNNLKLDWSTRISHSQEDLHRESILVCIFWRNEKSKLKPFLVIAVL